MLVSSIGLFDNRFKNSQKTNLNKKNISFEASPKGTGKVVDGAKKAEQQISPKVRRLLENYEELRKKGLIKEGDTPAPDKVADRIIHEL